MFMKRKYVNVGLIILLSLVSYINVFDNEFVWDDHIFILDNTDIKSFSNIPLFFKEDVDGLYRPLRGAYYTVAYSIFRKNEFGYHLNAVFFHTLISILVFFIIKKIVEKKDIALIAALIFAVHPIHTERVANMTAGFDLLGIFLFLLSFYFYVLHSKNNNNLKYFAFSLIAFVFALFASEEAITLPFLVILYEFSFNKEGFNIKKCFLKNHLIYFIIALLFIILRFFILGIGGRVEEYLGGSFYLTMLTMAKVLIMYILLLLFPLNLTLFYDIPVASGLFDFTVLISLIILALILFYTVNYYKKNIVFFSVFWFFITLLPFSNIIPIQVFMAERYLYVPSIGFTLLFAYLIYNIYNLKIFNQKTKKIVAIIFLTLLLSFYAGRSIVRNNDWENNLTLWTKTVETNPFNSRAHDNLGFTYDHLGQKEKAFAEFQTAVELMPSNFRALSNLGAAYGQRGGYNKSITFLQKALQINPLHYKTYDKLGLVYFEIEDDKKAIESFEKAVEINPRYAKAYNDLGTVYGRIGEFNLALENFKKALSLDKDYADAHYNLGILYEFLGREEARQEFEAAFRLEPDNELYSKKIKE